MYKWLKLETDAGPAGSSCTPLEEVTATQDGYQKRLMTTQDLIRRAVLQCGAEAPLGRAPRGNMAIQLSDAGQSQRQQKAREMGEWSRCIYQIQCVFAKTTERMEGHTTKCLRSSKKQLRMRAGRVRDQGKSRT